MNRSNRSQLAIETLETREVPSSVTFSSSTGIVNVIGDPTDDALTVSTTGSQVSIQLRNGGLTQTSSFDANLVNQIRFDGRGGTDTVNNTTSIPLTETSIPNVPPITVPPITVPPITLPPVLPPLSPPVLPPITLPPVTPPPSNSGTVNTTFINGVLNITGSDRDDVVRITPNGTGVALRVTSGGLTINQTTPTLPTQIRFDGRAGNDRFENLTNVRANGLGGDGNDFLRSGAGADTLLGQAGNDSIYGFDGADLIDGGTGDDLVVGGNGNDRMFGNVGNDRIYGEAGNDMLDGGTGNDSLYGGVGRDTLYGRDGNDLLHGGSTADGDYAFGGAGLDLFISIWVDGVMDFELSKDRYNG